VLCDKILCWLAEGGLFLIHVRYGRLTSRYDHGLWRWRVWKVFNHSTIGAQSMDA
jgi:hypothetical protein